MIVEVTGPSGVGKSTYIESILGELSSGGFATGAILSSEVNNCGLIPNYFSNLGRHNIKTDLLALPWFLLFIIANPRFLFFSLRSIISIDGSLPDKIAMLRSFVRKAGINRFLRCHRFSEFIIIVDEGLFHSAHNFLCSPNRCAKDEEILTFFELCPFPDRLIVLNAPKEKLFEHLACRGDFSPRIKNDSDLMDFITHARTLFTKIGYLCTSNNVGISMEVDNSNGLNQVKLGTDYIIGTCL